MNQIQRAAILVSVVVPLVTITTRNIYDGRRNPWDMAFVAVSSYGITNLALNFWEKRRRRKGESPRRPTRRSSPLNAETVLHLILPPEKCDDQVNSLEEIYDKKKVRIGTKRADIWYWKATLGLVWRQLFRGHTKSAIVKLVCWFLRLCGLANVADLLAKAADEVASEASRTPRRRRP